MLTLVVLLLPKILGASLAMRDRVLRREFGGSGRLCVSLLVEQLFSMLLAPTMMLFHSTFVAQTLLGRSVSWNAQERTERGVTLREAFRRQKWHLALGVLWGAAMLRLAPQFFWWLTPVLAGLLFGIPLTMWTSRVSAGRLFRRHGLLLTPEETAPPPELLLLAARGRRYQAVGFRIRIRVASARAAIGATAAPAAEPCVLSAAAQIRLM